MSTQRILADHHLDAFRQSVKTAPHVRCFRRQPDARHLRPVQRAQTGQPHHAHDSTTASNARKCCASNPGPTSRLRPLLSRTSIASLCSLLASGAAAACVTSTNLAASACLSRFFQAKNCGAHTPRSRQNAAILCPLRACSKTTFRHFVHTFLLRCCRLIPQHFYTRT